MDYRVLNAITIKNCYPISRIADLIESLMSWLGKMAKSLFIFLFLFLQLQDGAWESIMWLRHNITIGDRWSHMVTSQVTVTVCHMTKVTWGPWESKRIATVVKCISSREMSENSIKFSLSNSEQRDSWLNSGHWTLDTDNSAKPQSLPKLIWDGNTIMFASEKWINGK